VDVREDMCGNNASAHRSTDWSAAGHREEQVAAGFTFDRFTDANLADPYPLYAQAREQQPVFYAEDFGTWVISRYADVRRVLMDPMRFSSAFQIRTPQRMAPGVAEILAEGHPEVPALLNEDPPGHRRTRDLVARAFSPRRISGLEPRIVALVEELVDGFEARKEADLVGELAAPLPLRVILDLIGLPAGEAATIRDWTRQLGVLTSYDAEPEAQREAARGSVDYERYVAAEIAARRDNGRDDLLTDMITAQAPGVPPLTDAELISLVVSLTFAGHETTSDLIGSALLRLLYRPELWKSIEGDPGLIANVVEETLRIDSPVQGTFRRAVFDVQVDGVTIPAGAPVFALFASADRDGSMFGEPDEFDPGRAELERSLAFGRGIHYCLGAPLARLESQTVLRILRRRLPTLHLDPDFAVPYLPNLMHRGPHRLPTTWT
jgi:cytochrome P450